MSQYKVSVVVPTFNTGDFLVETFESFRCQTIGFENIEVIFVDDASSDDYTLDLLEELDSCYSNVSSVFLDVNSGFPGTGRNVGLDLAQGECVIFADHDDTYEENALEIMYNEIKYENADVVISNYYRVYDDIKIEEETIFAGGRAEVGNISDDLRLFEIGPSIWTKLFRKDFLIKNNIRFLEGMLAEDLELYVHILFLADKIIYLDDFYSYNYRIRDSWDDKSTIHLRKKETFENMIKGYYKIDKLLIELNKEIYFSNIFRRHFIYWILSLGSSNISNNDKLELIKYINPLFKKQIQITPGFNEKQLSSLTKPILKDDYKKILKNIIRIKKVREFKSKIKNIFKH